MTSPSLRVAASGDTVPASGKEPAPGDEPVERQVEVEVDPDSEIGEEDPGAALDQPAVEPIYPPGTHGH